MQAISSKNVKRSQDSLPNATGSQAMMSNPSNPATLLTGSQPDINAALDESGMKQNVVVLGGERPKR